MPTLTPSYLPPPPAIASPSSSCASSKITCPSATGSQVSTPPTSPERDAATQRLNVPLKRERALKIPFVKLDMPVIQEDMAACLAVALLGHVLFLKSQVPFPVAQLGRVPGASSASRAAKKRADMITAFDELSSHLHTTFSALSTALARNPAHRGVDTVYLALVLGPTIGAPKARVVLALEGLEVKIWGKRDDSGGARARPSSDGCFLEDDDIEDCNNGDDGCEVGDDSTYGDTEEDAADSNVGDAEESLSSPPGSEPPSSRSPSPSSEEPSQPSSPAPASSSKRPLRPSLSPKSSQSSSPSQPYLSSKPARTHAEEQQVLRAAERLLARALVNAYSEGGGMAAELAPTQTHVLLRAPRGFSHPAWLPRQNVSTSLENTLQDFLVDSCLGDVASTRGDGKPRRRGGASIKTEGVLVTCQTSPEDHTSHPAALPITMTEAREEDELIWWAWDGKLIGFAEW